MSRQFRVYADFAADAPFDLPFDPLDGGDFHEGDYEPTREEWAAYYADLEGRRDDAPYTVEELADLANRNGGDADPAECPF